MKNIRTIYTLKDNKVDSVRIEPLNLNVGYSSFVKDDEIIINSRRKKLDNTQLLIDIAHIYYMKEIKHNNMSRVEGMTYDFIKSLHHLGITSYQLEGALTYGRDSYKGKGGCLQFYERITATHKRYIVGGKPRLYKQTQA